MLNKLTRPQEDLQRSAGPLSREDVPPDSADQPLVSGLAAMDGSTTSSTGLLAAFDHSVTSLSEKDRNAPTTPLSNSPRANVGKRLFMMDSK
jgi:hypothetical protein